MTFDLHVRVPFTSRCLFKGVIESGSYKQVQDTFAQFIDQLRPVMTVRERSGPGALSHHSPIPIGSLGLGRGATSRRRLLLQGYLPGLAMREVASGKCSCPVHVSPAHRLPPPTTHLTLPCARRSAS